MPRSEFSIWHIAKLLNDHCLKSNVEAISVDLNESAQRCEDKCEKLVLLKLVEELQHQRD